ncbi:MAG: dUTP diphosphatase [Candidatus Pacebacteria bacterium]|nr:dUTP diphosphatase [Candidatus Paceibacterota bacterium]MBP9839882.1 dUTP diphosphatase [Candidatus Paceibacterota bacterium]
MKIKVKRLKEDAKLPSYHHEGDVGMDLYSMEEVTIPPMGHHRFWHGFALEFPVGYAGIIKDKSSISKAGLHAMGGVFDAGFRGEYNTHLVNLSNEPYTVEVGDKVSQLVLFPVAIAELEEVDSLTETSRGEGGFGSTGRK